MKFCGAQKKLWKLTSRSRFQRLNKFILLPSGHIPSILRNGICLYLWYRTITKNEKMKKIVLILLAVCFSFFAQAQEVPQTQSSLIIKKTASWCAPCGGWGWELFEHLVEDNNEQAILWANHYSGDLVNETTIGIVSNLVGDGQPRFYLDNTEISGSATAMRSQFSNMVTANAAKTPLANAIATNISTENNQINLTAKSTFFAEADGDFYLNVYIVEDGVINDQAGQGANAVHEKVLRDEMAGHAFGLVLSQGAIAANTSFSTDFSIPIANSWNADNIELSTVIWKKVGNKYEFVNGTETRSLVAALHTPQLTGVDMTISPNPATSTNLTISLEFSKPFSGALGLYDLDGRLLQSLAGKKELNTISGVHQFGVSLNQTLQPGIYLIRLSDGDGVLTQKVVVQ